jgi:aminoglycoside phosphotransferase (APT) family kinase protein
MGSRALPLRPAIAPVAVVADVLTPDDLTPLLREHIGPGTRCTSVVRGPLGNGQETWFVEVDGGGPQAGLVLRRSAEGGALPWTDRALEFSVLRAVEPHGLPVPAALWLETAPSSLGRPYLVMERAPGAPLGRADRETRRAVARQLGLALAQLHALPLEQLELALPRPPDGAAAARNELGRWRDRYRSARLSAVPLLGAMLAWLEVNAPEGDAPVVLLWGDPGPHNVLVAEGRLSALLDWELAHLGHPLDDLGAAVWACAGMLDPQLVVDAYESEGGAPVDRDALRWFECLACVSRSVMLLEGNRAYAEGRTVRPAMAGLGLELLASCLERAARAAGWPEAAAASAQDADAPAVADTGPAGLRPSAAEVARGVGRFLAEEVLDGLDDRALRQGVKVAAALLETVALRAEIEPAVQAERELAERSLLAELADGGLETPSLEEAAIRVEREERLAEWRPRVRRHLLQDLALTRALLVPLHRLYAPDAPRGRRAG